MPAPSEMKIKAEHEAAFWLAVNYIDECLSAGAEVPNIMIRHVIGRLKGQRDKALSKNNNKVTHSLNKVLGWLEGLNGYNINWRLGSDQEENNEHQYTLAFFSFLSLNAYYDYESDQKEMSKEKAAKFFYQLLMEEVVPYLAQKDRDDLSKPYKIGVFVGAFTQAVGYSICGKKSPSVKDFYQGTRYMIKKVNSQNSGRSKGVKKPQ